MLQRLKNQKGILLLIITSVTAIIATSSYGVWNLAILNNNMTKLSLYDSHNHEITEIRKIFLEMRITANSVLLENNYSSHSTILILSKDLQIRRLLASYENSPLTPKKLVKLHKFRFNYDEYIRQLRFVDAQLKNHEKVAPKKISQLKIKGEYVIEAVDELITLNNQEVENFIQDTHHYYRSRISYVGYLLIICTVALILAYFRVVVKMKKAEEKHQFIAYYDSLTNLPNQTYLFEKITTEIINTRLKAGKKLFIFFINIDDFKVINNTLGYEYGDQLLDSVAQSLKYTFNGTDYFVSRFGGDEFALLSTGIYNQQDVIKVADELLKLFQNPWSINNQDIHIGVSIGISSSPEDGSDSGILLQRANIAMNRAKELGKNQYQFFQMTMYDSILNNKEMAVKLRQALTNNEFSLYYQPQINSKTGEIVGVEALIRWISPEYGVIPPFQFISIAETTGLIVDMGKWIIQEACRQNKEWQLKGYPPVYMAVNISAVQLQHRNFLNIVNNLLAETDLDPKYLELEITESVLMESIESTIGTLQSLKNVGVKISLDDFGTGFSSLNYLRKLPINTLKIDRSFITNIENNPVENEILETIISLAHKLNLTVIAEGVETHKQLSQLVDKKCDSVQGYLISKPLPPEEMEHLIAQGYFQL